MDWNRLTTDATALAKQLLVRGYSDKMTLNQLVKRFYFKDHAEVRKYVKFTKLHEEIDAEYGKVQ
jgi:hypothetical protein